jgi:hypothetical protein
MVVPVLQQARTGALLRLHHSSSMSDEPRSVMADQIDPLQYDKEHCDNSRRTSIHFQPRNTYPHYLATSALYIPIIPNFFHQIKQKLEKLGSLSRASKWLLVFVIFDR